MNATTHPAVRDYLRAVDRALAGLPRARREEIVAELREHVDAALTETDGGEAAVRTVLDRLGSPADIAAEACERFGVPEPQPGRAHEITALFLISAGSVFLPGLGWLVGIVLVYSSRVWTLRDRIMATLLFPFGMFPALLILTAPLGTRECMTFSTGSTVCHTAGNPPMVEIVLVAAALAGSTIGTLVTTYVLARRMRANDQRL